MMFLAELETELTEIRVTLVGQTTLRSKLEPLT